jgi:hypothetical protein
VRTSSKVLLFAALASIWWACGGPNEPSPQPLRGLEITGPTQIVPGETGQFRAIATFGDGSTQDVTFRTLWRSSKSDVLRISDTGVAQGVSRGEVVVSAEMSRVRRQTTVLVLPQGTYKLSGRITEPGGPIAGAVAEVVSGTGLGLLAASDTNGFYALYGVAGSIRLRLSKTGFTDQMIEATVTEHTRQDFELKLRFDSLDISGSWRLTVSASPACNSTLPEALRQREFSVTIAQSGNRITLTPSSPTLVRKTAIDGRIYSDFVTATLWFDDYYLDYGLLDRVTPTDWVGIRGSLQGTVKNVAIDGLLDGAFDYYVTNPGALFPSRLTATCAADPNFVLRRE